MSWNDLATIIKLTANRVRCSNCNSVSSKALFYSKPEIKFKSSFFRPSGPPMVKRKEVLIRNSMKITDTQTSLTRLCMICGETREMKIPNI